MNRPDHEVSVERPSRFAMRLLAWSLPRDRYDDITGDLNEVFSHRCRNKGVSEARWWYLGEALMLSIRFLLERVRESFRLRTASALTRRFFRSFGISPIDVRLGVRMLIKNPGLTVVSTVALAIAIAIVAGFHTATQFMVRPTLPDADGDRLVAIWQHDLERGARGSQTLGDALTWEQELETVESVGAFRLEQRGVAVAGRTRLVRAATMTPSVFDIMRIPPVLGRPLVDADTQPGAAKVAVIGYHVWQTSFDGEASVLDETIRVGGVAHTVVGVMPESFRYPMSESLWLPLEISAASLSPDSSAPIDFAVARLAEGADLEALEAELQVAGAGLATAYPESHGRLRPQVARYAESFLASQEPALPILMQAARVAIGVVLLIVAVNVGTLVYARNAARLGEVAVRMALGASRRRIVIQMFIEALLLGLLAALAGVGIMLFPLLKFRQVFDAEVAQGDGSLPFWFDFGLGTGTVLLVAGLTLAAAVLTGVLPALKLTSRQVQASLQRLQQSGSGLRFGRTTTLVVVAQVALSVALLTVGGAQLQTFVDSWWSHGDDRALDSYLRANLRWDESGSVAQEVIGAPSATEQTAARRELARRAVSELGVEGVTFSQSQGIRFFVPEGADPASFAPGSSWSYVLGIEPNFFDVRHTPLRSGRQLGEADLAATAAPVAVVNEAFARALLPSGDPVGQIIYPFNIRAPGAARDRVRIVGVVQDEPTLEISHRGPSWLARPAVYVPLRDAANGLGMLVRARGEPANVIGPLQTLAASVDPTMVLHQLRTMEDAEEFGMTMVGIYGMAVGFFVFAALLLSTTGVYAMMSFTATQRTREIGIRAALGAPSGRVIAAVFSRAIKQLGAGIVIGLGIGYLGADGPMALSAGLFDQGPGVVLAVAVTIFLLGLFACGKPMRRALSIAPTEALRTDG